MVAGETMGLGITQKFAEHFKALFNVNPRHILSSQEINATQVVNDYILDGHHKNLELSDVELVSSNVAIMKRGKAEPQKAIVDNY